MAQFANYTAPDGSQHKVPIPEGADPAATVEAFESTRVSQPRPLSTSIPELDAPGPVPTSIEEANALRANRPIDPLIGTNVPTTLPESVERGVAMSGRLAAFPAVAATGVADLVSTIANLGISGLDIAGQKLFKDEPLTPRLPTDASASLNEFLNQIFPEPQGLAENIAIEGGQFALSGGATDAALAAKAITKLLPTASRNTFGGNLAADIGQSVSKAPKVTAVGEVGGATGAIVGEDLGERADLGPGGRAIATTLGALFGGGTPVIAANVARPAGRAVAETLLPGTKTGSEVRGAKRVQAASEDISADVTAIRERPEGVLPGRATGDEGLMALEAKVLADDPKFAKQVTGELAEAEQRTLKTLADEFGPETNKAEWQQEVILQGTPEGASIKIGQPDEMIAEAAIAFDSAYDAVKGFKIQTQNVVIDGKPTTLRSAIEDALSDPDILTTPAIQERVSQRIQARLTKLEKGGEFVEGSIAVQTNSDDFLSLRQAIRKKERALSKTAATNADAAEEAALLANVNRVLTEVLDGQLPAEAAAALRATDIKYGDFKTAERAINRSKTGDLTAENLQIAVRQAGVTSGQIARSETGELGRLARTGRDVSKVLGKPEEAARLVRDMTPEQLQQNKANFKVAISAKSQTKGPTGNSRLDGAKFLDNLGKQRETLKAAGFTDKDIGNLELAARELKVIQKVAPAAVERLINDNVNTVIRFLGALAGSQSATRAMKIFGGGGSGPSLIIAGFGSRAMSNRLKSLSVDQADSLITQAFRGETRTVAGVELDLLEAMLVKSTAGLREQAQAARTINAFLLAPTALQEAPTTTEDK